MFGPVLVVLVEDALHVLPELFAGALRATHRQPTFTCTPTRNRMASTTRTATRQTSHEGMTTSEGQAASYVPLIRNESVFAHVNGTVDDTKPPPSVAIAPDSSHRPTDGTFVASSR